MSIAAMSAVSTSATPPPAIDRRVPLRSAAADGGIDAATNAAMRRALDDNTLGEQMNPAPVVHFPWLSRLTTQLEKASNQPPAYPAALTSGSNLNELA